MFKRWLNDDSKIILFDGAMGTEIFKRGIEPGKIPDLLNIEQPNIITEIHESYYKAGSDMCQTCTFGSTTLNLERYKLVHKMKEINEKAVINLRKVCPPNCLVAGDIGPNGDFRPPVGTATPEQWYLSFLNQVKILENGIDLWHIETISDVEEMVSAIKAIKEVSEKPIIGSMTYRKTKRGYFTIMGDSLEKCIKLMEQEDVDVIGTNCTLGSKEMIGLTRETARLTDKPISVKPNAGKPRFEGEYQIVYDQTIKEFGEDIKEMINLGAKIVGGCCGTSPQTIKEIRKIIDSL